MKRVTHQKSILLSHGALFVFLIFMLGCSSNPPVKIGISKASRNYIKWLTRADSTIQVIDLYSLPIDSAVNKLKDCSALLMTGGEDVYPGWYGKENDTIRCTEMNRHRDSLEMALISNALQQKMPIFAICRGHQILDVFLGGTLVIDIPSDIRSPIKHQCDDYLHCFHAVLVKPNSILARLSGCDSVNVTTNHHQAVENLSPMLSANAFAHDSVIEGFEWKRPDNKSFLIGVQWHPERMEKNNPLSGRLADEFINQAKKYSENKKSDIR